MSKRFVLAALTGMLMLSLAACSTGRPRATSNNYSSGGGYGNESLSQQVARHEQQLQTILSQVGQVEQVLPGQAEMWSQMQTMRQDVNSMAGKVDDLQNQVSGSGTGEIARLNERVTRLEALVRKMAAQFGINADNLDEPSAIQAIPAHPGAGVEPAGAGEPVITPPAAPVAPSAGVSPAASGGAVDTATALYDAGIKAFDQRRYKDAIVSFKDFGATFPKHKYASNAHFWQGECYFQLKDYPRAILAYQEVIAKYPNSNKLQSAMLKQGMALHSAGKKEAAKERLQELIKKFPGSPEASRAKQFMQTNK